MLSESDKCMLPTRAPSLGPPVISSGGRSRGPVAQWLEQGTHNPLVGGSNPSRPTFPQEEVSLRKGVVSGAVGGYGSELLRIDQGNLLRCWGRWRIRDDALALQDLEYVLEYGLVMLLDHDVFGLLFEGVKILKIFLKLKG